MKVAVARRLLTRDDFHRMGAAGILTEDDRVELLNGELIGSEQERALPPLSDAAPYKSVTHVGHLRRK
jgi:hypothetical protein